MSGLAELIETVEHTVGTTDALRQQRLLLGVTDLLVNKAPALSDAHLHAFDAVIGRLIDRAETDARQAVAERVSALPEPPPGLVRRLAADVAAPVASPILCSRIPIPDAALIHLAQSRSPAHLAAIAQRAILGERVCEAIAANGDDTALGTLLNNAGARLSDTALTLIATRIVDEDILFAGLAQRTDLDPENRVALLRDRMRRKDDARAQRVGTLALQQSRARAEKAVALRVKIGLDEDDIQHWLDNGRTAEALIALSQRTTVPADEVFAAQISSDPLAITRLVRSAGLGPGTLIRFLRGRTPPSTGEAMREALALLNDPSTP